jgi:hypothetical protein
MDLIHHRDLDGFVDFSDAELVIIREALHQEAETRDTASTDD